MAILELRAARALGPAFATVLIWSAILLVCAGYAQAAELPKPSGAIVLSISGNIGNHNRKGSQGENIVDIDMPMLQALGSHRFKTETPWTENDTEFEGATLRALMAFVEAGSNSFKATALDEYSINVAGLDLSKYPVIVAYAKNGKPMQVRELGPLWIMFPFDDFPELLNEKNKAAAIWQLIAIVVE